MKDIATIGGPFNNDESVNSDTDSPRLGQHIIYERLQRARQLRASLEEAADRAEALPDDDDDDDDSPGASYAKAMAILQSSISEIDQLVRLTKVLDCVQGGSTDDAATDAIIWSQLEIEKQRQLRDERVIRRQLRLFAKERNPHLALDDELESWNDALIDIPDFNTGSIDDGMTDRKVASEMKTAQIDEEASLDKLLGSAITYRESAKKDDVAMTDETNENNVIVKGDSEFASSFYKLSGRESCKRVAKVVDAQESDKTKEIASGPNIHAKVTHALLVPPPSKRARIERRENCDTSSTPITPNPASAADKTPTADDPPPPLPPRKCHECKIMCTRYRSCNYWTWDVKCIKKYCIPCLLSKYTLGCDVIISDTNPNATHPADEIGINPEHDKEWHCPSCVAHRESEEERERIRMNEASRKSSRIRHKS